MLCMSKEGEARVSELGLDLSPILINASTLRRGAAIRSSRAFKVRC